MTELSRGEDVRDFLRRRSNWGRWGENDELGTLNLVTAETRLSALGRVRTGQTVSLSRPIPLLPVNGEPAPAVLETIVVPRDPEAGSVVDRLTLNCHNTSVTHIDALCHIWDRDGNWNGGRPDETVTADGVRFAGIDAFRAGIVTRGVLFDVPAHRGTQYVTQDWPVTAVELDEIGRSAGIALEPGDAICIYSGRDRWDEVNPVWGAGSRDTEHSVRPGLHASCLRFLREADVALLVWDMMDMRPSGVDISFTIHGAVWAFGLALVDNAELGALAAVCRAEGRVDFALCIAPLPIPGGTGSAVNPIALL